MKFVLTLAVVAVFANGHAAADPISDRKALMKEVGQSTKIAADLFRGITPYDAAAAKAAMGVIAKNVAMFHTLFPEGTETGGDTKARPEIWTNQDDFVALAKALETEAQSAAVAADAGLEAYKVAFPKVGAQCNACHDKYRLADK